MVATLSEKPHLMLHSSSSSPVRKTHFLSKPRELHPKYAWCLFLVVLYYSKHSPLSAGVIVTMGLTGWMLRAGGSAALATVFSASFRSVRVTPCQHRAQTIHSEDKCYTHSQLFLGCCLSTENENVDAVNHV